MCKIILSLSHFVKQKISCLHHIKCNISILCVIMLLIIIL